MISQIFKNFTSYYLLMIELSFFQKLSLWFQANKLSLRIINKTWFLEQTSPLIRQGRILKTINICSLQMGQFMYSYNHGILPEAFVNLFQQHNE